MKSLFGIFKVLALVTTISHSITSVAYELNSETVEMAQLVRSKGVRNCFSALEATRGELVFESIDVQKNDDSILYKIQGGRLQGDILSGHWVLEIKNTRSSDPEEGSTITCRILRDRESR